MDGQEWPRVSVIVPSYNQGTFIRRTLDSVLSQGYPDLEVIVVDGGSKDETVDIIRAYEPRLAYWVSEPDKGQSHAINKGLAFATGSLVGWLNSDDMYLPASLFRAASYLNGHPDCDVVFADYVFMDSSDKVVHRRREIPFDFATYLWTRDCYHANCAAMFRRSVFEHVGLVRQDLNYSMDFELYLRIADGGHRIDHVREFWGAYRLHGASKSVAHHDRQIREAAGVAGVYGGGKAGLRSRYFKARRLVKKLMAGCYRPWERLRGGYGREP